MDFALTAFEHVLRRHVADGGMQAPGVVVLDIFAHPAFGFVEGARVFLANAFLFDGGLHPFLFAVGLRVVRTRAHMGHAR